LSRRNDY